MRKHLHLIISDEEDDSLAGAVASTDSQDIVAEKNVENVKQMRDLDTEETWDRRIVGMGYVDFEDEAEYHDTDRYADVVQRKLGEIDAEHLEKAGIAPEEVLA